jgi:hypothetical protein
LGENYAGSGFRDRRRSEAFIATAALPDRSLERQLAMAAPQFFVPPRVKPSRPKRRFTLEQANRTLPLVRRIVTDIVQVHQNALIQQEKLEKRQADSKARLDAEKQLQSLKDRFVSLRDELSNVGCELKDPQIGLIDFVGQHQGHDVYLCWKLGEQKISFWHELDAGFPGRQPISTLEESDK